MRIGNNRERIKIITVPVMEDAGGGILPVRPGFEEFQEPFEEDFGIPTESVYWETNAAVEEIKDKYKAEAYQVSIEEGIVFIVRNRNDKVVNKFMQVIFRNKRHTIHGIQDAGYRGRELKLICKTTDGS